MYDSTSYTRAVKWAEWKSSSEPPACAAPACTTLATPRDAVAGAVRFIRRLRTEGRIPVVKLGKHIRIDSADLDSFITASRQEAWNGTARDGAA